MNELDAGAGSPPFTVYTPDLREQIIAAVDSVAKGSVDRATLNRRIDDLQYHMQHALHLEAVPTPRAIQQEQAVREFERLRERLAKLDSLLKELPPQLLFALFGPTDLDVLVDIDTRESIFFRVDDTDARPWSVRPQPLSFWHAEALRERNALRERLARLIAPAARHRLDSIRLTDFQRYGKRVTGLMYATYWAGLLWVEATGTTFTRRKAVMHYVGRVLTGVGLLPEHPEDGVPASLTENVIKEVASAVNEVGKAKGYLPPD